MLVSPLLSLTERFATIAISAPKPQPVQLVFAVERLWFVPMTPMNVPRQHVIQLKDVSSRMLHLELHAARRSVRRMEPVLAVGFATALARAARTQPR